MIEMLKLAEEAATTQGEFSLVSIDPNTIVFTLINTLIIFLIYFLKADWIHNFDQKLKKA